MPARYQKLVHLHDETVSEFLRKIDRLTQEQSEKIGSDGRKIKVIIAHIMAWEEWQLQVFEEPDIEKRLQKLIMQINLQGYFDKDTGKTLNFGSVDEFNHYQEEKYKDAEWEIIKIKTHEVALRLRQCFSKEREKEWIDFFEMTPVRLWRSIDTKAGWYLWMVSLRHEAIEHAQDFS